MDMYNPIIVDHFSNPRNAGEIKDKDYQIKIGNPVCGDTIFLDLKLEQNHVIDAKFRAYGCAGSIATASIFSEYILGKSISQIVQTPESYKEKMLGELEPPQMHCLHILKQLFEYFHQLEENSYEQVK
jgi:nitrogen fixation protein NifU and related proteins